MGDIMVEVVWDPLCQDISHAYYTYIKDNISTHGSLWRGQLCLSMARYHSRFCTIADILIAVQRWYAATLQRESDQLWGAIVTIRPLTPE